MGKPLSVTPDGGFALSGVEKSSSLAFGRYLSGGEKAFLEKTDFSKSTYPPVNVILHSSTENLPSLPALNVDAIEGGAPRISVHLRVGEQGIESTQLLVAALMLREYYGENAPAPGSGVPHFPSWVIHGMATLCFPPEESFRIPSSYLNGGTPPKLGDFLIQRAPEFSNSSLSDLYDATASLLLKAGLASPAGQSAFRKWIGHHDPKLTGSDPSRWVGGWEMKTIERRWLLLMAGSSTDGEGGIKLQNIPETLKSYDAVMSQGLSGGATIGSLAHDKKTGTYTLAGLSDRLKGIRLRSNPFVTPLIDRTLILIEKAPKLSEKKIAAEEKSLEELGKAMMKQFGEIDAYLDWYEATRLPVRSGYFDRLLRNPGAEIRKGPIGRHIDAVEERGW
jgi:hypothetical protein